MQAKCLRLVGKKLLVALAMEGKFAGEGLQTLDEDDDVLTSMARELVEKNGIGDSADAVWKQLNAEHQRLFPTRPEAGDSMSALDIPPVFDMEIPAPSNGLIEEALHCQSVLVFGQRQEELRVARRRASSPSWRRPVSDLRAPMVCLIPGKEDPALAPAELFLGRQGPQI